MTRAHIVDQQDMERIAADCARAARIGDCFALSGDLGAGKSTFARAFIRALAGDMENQLTIPSPTFTLVQNYVVDPPVSHFDLYRIADPLEVEELGLTEALDVGIALVEWPENGGDIMPRDPIRVSIEMVASDPMRRAIAIAGPPEAMARLDRSLAIRQMLIKAGWGAAHRLPFAADASARGYEFALLAGQKRFIMDAPRMPDGPPVRDGKPYSQLVHLAENVDAFIAVANGLQNKGFAAPAIFGADRARGLILLDDLGDGKIVDSAGAPIAERYLDSAHVLADLHQEDWPDTLEIDSTAYHHLHRYDHDVFVTEASLLIDWYVPWKAGRALSDAQRSGFIECFTSLHTVLMQNAADWSLLLRDYHSPNIIWRTADRLKARVGLIDFQDALIGPRAYDVMSLAEDARVDVPDALRAEIVDAYCTRAASFSGRFDRTQFEREAAIVAAQRAAKILGIFVRLDQRDGKPAYLRHLPRVEGTLRRALLHPALAPLQDWLDEAGVLGHG